MQLHQLTTSSDNKKKKRIGRGGKRGTTSGRGQKGQKSRAGRRIRQAVAEVILRIPKHRGFKNKPKSPASRAVDIAAVVRLAGSPQAVDMKWLRAVGLVPKRYQGPVKLLGKTEVSQSLTIKKEIAVSQSVKAAIEKAGGKVL
jgi:large subunit ribosomal protein L15